MTLPLLTVPIFGEDLSRCICSTAYAALMASTRCRGEMPPLLLLAANLASQSLGLEDMSGAFKSGTTGNDTLGANGATPGVGAMMGEICQISWEEELADAGF